MRGKVPSKRNNIIQQRITPAHAGKSSSSSLQSISFKDHPRSCGEKQNIDPPSVKFIGSPPLMRGKALDENSDCHATRITPAHVGKRWGTDWKTFLVKDHPRSCGEKRFSLNVNAHKAGSPPLMRGKELLHVKSCCQNGITPAHAGKRNLDTAHNSR